MASKGMDAVIAKAGKKAPLFKRKLAAKLEAGNSAKSAPKAEYGEKKAEKSGMGEMPKHEAMQAKVDDLEKRLTALEAKIGRDEVNESEDESEDDMESDD